MRHHDFIILLDRAVARPIAAGAHSTQLQEQSLGACE
jgi:hypothetical protein